jgi:class 3 adenylate cyclase/tetratricopeptide (TPR) repeat protein
MAPEAAVAEALARASNAEALDLAQAAGAAASHRLQYLAALACSRMGAVAEAEARLARIDGAALDAPLAAEVTSLRGRLAKDRGDPRAALGFYREALRLSPAAYPAVNAATMAHVLGDARLCHELSTQALRLLPEEGDYWDWASRGEALLHLGRLDDASRAYARARELAGARSGDVASMRRQLRLVGSPEALRLAEILAPATVMAFTGHMIDAPGRPSPRFPAAMERDVASRIEAQVARHSAVIGYSQAACGADLLFLEAVQRAGHETQVVLPFARTDFVRESVEFAGASWVPRFERALERAARVTYATEEPYLGDDVLFEHASNLIQGMAMLRAAELGTRAVMLAVADPSGGDALGGTVANVRRWKERGGEVEQIALASQGTTRAATRSARPNRAHRVLKAILFADITGFSRMPEEYSPRFAQLFLGAARDALDRLRISPADANTRGDGLYIVFDEPAQAADFALELRDAIGAIAWTTLGMPGETQVRIGLHLGPVFETPDPIMGKPTFNGSHVNRAARLEPIVRPGEVFVTHAFAATLALEPTGHRCEYIGVTPLAKGFGAAPLYRLLRG